MQTSIEILEKSPEVDIRSEKIDNYIKVLKYIVEAINKHKDYSYEKRFELVHTHLADANSEYIQTDEQKTYLNILIDFFSSEYFRKQNGKKKKKSKRTEEEYYSKAIETVGDYLLEVWDKWEGRDKKLNSNTVLSKYKLDKIKNDYMNKVVVGFNTNVITDYDDCLEHNLSHQFELHVDQILKYTSKSDNCYHFSENIKKKKRKESVIKELNNYPILKESFEVWKDIGMKYGFDEFYTKEEKNNLKKYWIENFTLDKDNCKSPKNRYYLLHNLYNSLGYELFVYIEELRKPSEQTSFNTSYIDIDSIEEEKFEVLNWTDEVHVNGLLTIQRVAERDVSGYFPIYYMLKDKYKKNISSVMRHKLDEFDAAVKYTDFTEVERDILDLIMGIHKNYNVFEEIMKKKKNPYQLISEYINIKFGLKKSKTNIVNMVKKKLSRSIANTHKDLTNNIGFKVCTKCKKSKLASTSNFGVDKRKKDGLKSACKKCLKEKNNFF